MCKLNLNECYLKDVSGDGEFSSGYYALSAEGIHWRGVHGLITVVRRVGKAHFCHADSVAAFCGQDTSQMKEVTGYETGVVPEFCKRCARKAPAFKVVHKSDANDSDVLYSFSVSEGNEVMPEPLTEADFDGSVVADVVHESDDEFCEDDSASRIASLGERIARRLQDLENDIAKVDAPVLDFFDVDHDSEANKMADEFDPMMGAFSKLAEKLGNLESLLSELNDDGNAGDPDGVNGPDEQSIKVETVAATALPVRQLGHVVRDSLSALIPADSVAKVIRKVNKVNSGLDKDVMTIDVLGVEYVPDGGMGVELTRVRVGIDMPSVFDGWDMAYRIEHNRGDDGNYVNIVTANPSCGDAPRPEEFKSVAPICDHCKVNRKRLVTYVMVRDGEVFMVGKSCLYKYTQVPKIARKLTLILKVMEQIEAESQAPEYGRRATHARTLDVLATAVRVVELFGYAPTSSSERTPTRDLVKEALAFGGIKVEGVVRPIDVTASDEERAAKVLNWCRGLGDGASGYLHNLYAATIDDVIELRHVGLVASAVTAYDRATQKDRQRREERERLESDFVGEVGDRVHFGELTIESAMSVASYSQWSEWVDEYTFVDPDGKIIMWSTSADFSGDEGDIVQGKATVKYHKVIDGKAVTIVNRPRFKVIGKREE